jgi:TatA/E family protein of Tat protein translocase
VVALIGPWDFVIILVVLLLVFGTRRFGSALRGIGRSGRELKRGLGEGDDRER